MDVLVFTKKMTQQLKALAQQCMDNPSLLHDPKLSFIKELIEHYGGKVPESDKNDKSDDPLVGEYGSDDKYEDEPQSTVEPDSESEESNPELDMTGVIGLYIYLHYIISTFYLYNKYIIPFSFFVLEPDQDPPPKMGNLTLQPTEEEIAESQSKRSEAVSAFVEEDYEKAKQLYTEAIVLNPQAALLYAKRGQIFLLLNKPNACIRDCERAIELNPDSAAAHKFRGRAHHLLGKFEEAANDLRLACKFDFDEQADEWLRETTPNVSSFSLFLFCFIHCASYERCFLSCTRWTCTLHSAFIPIYLLIYFLETKQLIC